ncbi:hypothetical protein [Kitasatospora viridis]|uniref:Uncharacterized protein n=1 Tax=Kitasatospora viridis TaxID=281105 RepID=A0A561UD80_9ACTN|nr:hypothetical protein [Kitasatospora viridis]TWF97295.1 hypothetical protein FHX73_111075 [Kitasatospora viridis]
MGIAGFEPSFLVGLDAVRQAHGGRLAALTGRRLTGFAVVRFAEDDDWFADCPVVLDFEGVQLELCHWKLDELSIGWGTIDTAATIAGWEWFELTPRWSRRDDRLESLLGRELREVALLEWRPPSDRRDLAAGTVAVEFAFAGGGRLCVSNALDENHLDTGPAHPDCLRHELGRAVTPGP